MHKHNLICGIILTIALGACVPPEPSDSPADKRAKGVISGIIMGGLAGTTLLSTATSSVYTAAASGAAIGVYGASRFVQENLNRTDKELRNSTIIFALDKGVSGIPYAWENKASKARGEVTPADQFSDESGNVCRNFIEITVANNQRVESSRSACVDPRGYWSAE